MSARREDSSRITPSAPTQSARVQRRRTRSESPSDDTAPTRLSRRTKSFPAAVILKNSVCMVLRDLDSHRLPGGVALPWLWSAGLTESISDLSSERALSLTGVAASTALTE